MTQREYEFDTIENQIIRRLSLAMRCLSIVLVILGFVIFASGTLAAWNYRATATFLLSSLQAAVLILFGTWTGGASQSFKLIVETEGHDIANLMAALKDLSKLFFLQFGLVVLAIALLIGVSTSQFWGTSQLTPPPPNQIQVE
ncbi:MAG: hypothetical protein AB4050_18860 [Synechococcus sp.]